MLTAQERAARIRGQREAQPEIYGSIDFDTLPLRFTTDPSVPAQMRDELADQRPRLLANPELVSVIADYTMLGDRVGDAYAGLMSEYGFKRLVDMLAEACDKGVDQIDGAPTELVDFIEDMERVPDWIDLALVERGARLERNATAHALPYVIRGGLLGTFANKYAALPMAVTGAFSERTSGKRVKETAAFFVSSVLPGALARDGYSFKSAAMVRLMHSMVRINVMRKGRWDSAEYGVPIPQADQMPAGSAATFALAMKVLGKGRREFTADERARVEFHRYRCFLLGLPEELLPTTPQDIVDVMATRHATLRAGWDDDTCGRLVSGTMSARFEPDGSLATRIREPFERSLSKVFFARTYVGGDTAKAAKMGIIITRADRARAIAAMLHVLAQMAPYAIADRLPYVSDLADRRLTRKVSTLLERYSGAEFRTDVTTYQPTPGAH
ncbi:oxygenase MpaB family protein [Mycolicibacterium helvum]|uniref:ER-bound oxygenase mpaB/mpaB'/Rubber oxygenase catalytic domain-containing protein n=1 Tax=Mycolicibacterium helvum TaxID=1534349 RepID=A0A7I7TE72_9MYCO|nr:oxygenase MpaB family protein [Mycolicibacterium helvum]BBY67033.1 hypothetical protein MHEL_52760 [Mycolicibacterium helvum]